MASGNGQRGRGSRGGSRGRSDPPGRRGRGRGGFRGRGGPAYSNELDFVVQEWRENPPRSNSFRGRGAGFGRASPNASGFGTPACGRSGHRGFADQSMARSRFNGAPGRAVQPLNSSAPLSSLLYSERPLLRPVVFVRSSTTPFLFQYQEDILQATTNVAEENCVPTADRVARVFSGHNLGRTKSPSEPDELEEINFDDMARLRSVPEKITFQSDLQARDSEAPTAASEEHLVGFYVDANPSLVPPTNPSVIDTMPGCLPLGLPMQQKEQEEEEEEIVYVAPYPRIGANSYIEEPSTTAKALEEHVPKTSTLTISELASTSMRSAPAPQVADQEDPPIPTLEIAAPPPASSISFAFPPASAATSQPRTRPGPKARFKAKRKESKVAQRKARRRARSEGFGLYGSILAEGKLHDGDGDDKDPRWHAQRRGDSDLDWGDESDQGDEDGGMVVDPDLDVAAMVKFVDGMSMDGQRFQTIADIEDAIAQVKDADEAPEDKVDDGAVNLAERVVLGESTSEDSDEDCDASDDDDCSPRTGFRVRLMRIRGANNGSSSAHATSLGLGDDRYYALQHSDESSEENLFHDAESMHAENDRVLRDFSRQGSDRVFRAIQNGEFDDIASMQPSPSRRSKGAHIPPELQQFWIKDRLKKAERKRARERERLERAADPLSPHRGGKKARKAMLAAFNRADSPLADRPVDMEALADRLRTFAKARDGRQTLNLPPMRKEDRKMVHELALGFGLKSKSKGRDEARYTTLTKTRNSGSGAEEWRIHKVLRQVRGGAGTVYGQRGGKGKGRAPMQRDGEEVGKAAPKIGASNVGFRMLASMGWVEGDRIGVTGGLEVPITAVIKNTKLGLGAK